MKKILLQVTVFAMVAALTGGPVRIASAADAKSPCVACHTGDSALGRLIDGWATAVDPKLLAKAQAAAPEGAKLKGKHMKVGAMVKSAPDDCTKCHSKTSKLAPPMDRLLHMIHLTGEGNKFATTAGAGCTSCHTLNAATGVVEVLSGPLK